MGEERNEFWNETAFWSFKIRLNKGRGSGSGVVAGAIDRRARRPHMAKVCFRFYVKIVKYLAYTILVAHALLGQLAGEQNNGFSDRC